MIKKIFTLAVAVFSAAIGTAQPAWIMDSVAMGPGYANDVYYSMVNGKIKEENNKNWHIAFSMFAGDSSAIWANHNGGNSFVKVYNPHKHKSQWASVVLNDTLTASICYNYDKSWSQGAFNDIPSPSPFNFGWGTYDLASHNVYGDSIFIVKANNVFYKLMIDSLQSITSTWHFRVGDFSGATTSHTLTKSGAYASSIFAYFNLATLKDTVREPDIKSWDIVFTRYNTLTSQMGGPILPYNVVGALGNRKIKFGKAKAVHPDSAAMNWGAYSTPWSKEIGTIGFDWKNFDMTVTPPAWVVPDSLTYFVLDTANNVWQLKFSSFGGTANGKIVFNKRNLVNITSVQNPLSILTHFQVFPVPASNEINIVLQSKETTNALFSLTDMQGKLLLQKPMKIFTGYNSYEISTLDLPAGDYILRVSGSQLNSSQKISIIK